MAVCRMAVNKQHYNTSLVVNTLSITNLLPYGVYERCKLERMVIRLPVLGDGGGLGVAEEGEGGAEVVGLRYMLVSGGESRRRTPRWILTRRDNEIGSFFTVQSTTNTSKHSLTH